MSTIKKIITKSNSHQIKHKQNSLTVYDDCYKPKRKQRTLKLQIYKNLKHSMKSRSKNSKKAEKQYFKLKPL